MPRIVLTITPVLAFAGGVISLVQLTEGVCVISGTTSIPRAGGKSPQNVASWGELTKTPGVAASMCPTASS